VASVDLYQHVQGMWNVGSEENQVELGADNEHTAGVLHSYEGA
jgi:hypothetical protein